MFVLLWTQRIWPHFQPLAGPLLGQILCHLVHRKHSHVLCPEKLWQCRWTGLQSSYSTIHGPLEFLDRRQMADMGPPKCMLVPLRVTKGTPPSSSQQRQMVEPSHQATAISTVLSLRKLFLLLPFLSLLIFSKWVTGFRGYSMASQKFPWKFFIWQFGASLLRHSCNCYCNGMSTT